MAEIEINGKKITAQDGDMLIKAAEENGVWIPRFCYHRKLTVAANCRMCLVEIEKARKPMPACATPVADGMKVFTQSQLALEAQKSVMEFLLINHPLDCPVCDQGGECELQDIAMGYGSGVSRYYEGKLSVKNENLGPLIATEMTRCIQCTRCVRFGEEIAGVRELGQTGRGESERIGTYVKHTMTYEMSGNIIDLCPVGALTSKPYRFSARAWEMDQYLSVAPHDCIGSNTYSHTRRGKLMRIVPRENDAINETWISDRDRFAYTGLHHADRLLKPMVKQNNQWQEVSWQEALQFAANSMQAVIDARGPEAVGALISPNSTTEEHYLLQRIMRGLGSHNVDHRLREVDFSDQKTAAHYPGFNMPVADLAKSDAILLVGSQLRKDQPIAGHHVRQASLQGASVMVINPVDYDFNFTVLQKTIVAPTAWLEHLSGVTKALVQFTDRAKELGGFLENVVPTAEQTSMAKALCEAKKPVIVLGLLAEQHDQAASIRALVDMIAMLSEGVASRLTNGANAAGAWLAGAVPHRTAGAIPVIKPGFDAQAQLQTDLDAYLLVNFDPAFDCANGAQALERLRKAPMVVALTAYKEPSLLDAANVLLPLAAFAETSGTFVNASGQWQSFKGASQAPGEARPAWKVLRVLGNIFKLPQFDYTSSEDVLSELKPLTESLPASYEWTPPAEIAQLSALSLVAETPIYRTDSITRHANCLQQLLDVCDGMVRINANTAALAKLAVGDKASLIQGKLNIHLPVALDERVADNTVVISTAVAETVGLMSRSVQLSKVV